VRQPFLPLTGHGGAEKAGNCRCSTTKEKIGEDLLRLSSSTQTASPSRSTTKMAAETQPPTRRPCLGPVMGARSLFTMK
jgi:hypothetical protein